MNRHVFLNNEKSDSPKFNRQRNVGGKKGAQNISEDIEENEPKIIYEFQKERLRKFHIDFYSRRKLRNENRKIELPNYIDLIKIKFYSIFNSDLRNKFLNSYGLFPVEFRDFNKTVIFEITDQNLFENFKDHIKTVINSKIGSSYQGQNYGLIALIYEFEFIDSKSRIFTYNNKGILINLFKSIYLKSEMQKDIFFNFLNESQINYSYSEISPDLIEIYEIDKQKIQFIADNFDIIKAITSSRTQRLIPGCTSPIRS